LDHIYFIRTIISYSTAGESRYVDADITPQGGVADFEVLY